MGVGLLQLSTQEKQISKVLHGPCLHVCTGEVPGRKEKGKRKERERKEKGKGEGKGEGKELRQMKDNLDSAGK